VRRVGASLLVMLGLGSACGDVTSDLISTPDAGASEAGECSEDSQCILDVRPRCETDSQRCVQCLQTEDCPSGSVCTLPAGTCVLGCGSAGCPASSPICDQATNLCRGCADNDECSADTMGSGEDRLCDDATGRCVECILDSHCDEALEFCSSVLGLCAPRCEDAGDCMTDDIYCDQTIGFCVECQLDEHCEPEEVCRNSECTEL
jgi:hypothetical protein